MVAYRTKPLKNALILCGVLFESGGWECSKTVCQVIKSTEQDDGTEATRCALDI